MVAFSVAVAEARPKTRPLLVPLFMKVSLPAKTIFPRATIESVPLPPTTSLPVRLRRVELDWLSADAEIFGGGDISGNGGRCAGIGNIFEYVAAGVVGDRVGDVDTVGELEAVCDAIGNGDRARAKCGVCTGFDHAAQRWSVLPAYRCWSRSGLLRSGRFGPMSADGCRWCWRNCSC